MSLTTMESHADKFEDAVKSLHNQQSATGNSLKDIISVLWDR